MMKEDRRRIGVGLAAALLVSFLTGFLIFHTLGFTYAIADDIIMRDIASGAFTGTPDGHLIFVRYALGFLISRLFLLNRSVDWYGFVIVGTLFLGLAGVLYRGFTARRSFKWKGFYGAFVLCLFAVSLLYHTAKFEWTVSAAFAGACGLYLYVTSTGETKGLQLTDGIFIWLLLLFTYCVRKDVFYMVIPGFGITFLWRFFKKEGKKLRFLFKELILPAAVFSCVGMVMLVESRAYQGEKWEEFQVFQELRSQVYDYSDTIVYDSNPAFFDELGLDEHDIRNLRHYALYLVEDMDTELMQWISWERRMDKIGGKSRGERIWEGICLTVKEMVNPKCLWISIPMLLFLAGVFWQALQGQKRMLLPVLLFLGAEGAMWLILGIRGRLPERVAYSMYVVMLLGAGGVFYRLCFLGDGETERQHLLQKKIPVMVLGALCVVLAGIRCQAAGREFTGEPADYQLFKDACKDDTDRIYFIETLMAEPLGGAVVTVHGDFRLNRCLTLGDWYSFSPLDEERFKVYGIENVEEAILNDPRVYLVIRDVENPMFYGTYFPHKYPGAELICREEKVVNGRSYYLYQVQR